MVERLKDDADRKLDELFGSDGVRDDGFSLQIMARIRRQIWVRRLSMPIAIVLGVALAAKPIAELFAVIPNLLSVVPVSVIENMGLSSVSLIDFPQSSTMFMGGMLIFGIMMISRILEE